MSEREPTGRMQRVGALIQETSSRLQTHQCLDVKVLAPPQVRMRRSSSAGAERGAVLNSGVAETRAKLFGSLPEVEIYDALNPYNALIPMTRRSEAETDLWGPLPKSKNPVALNPAAILTEDEIADVRARILLDHDIGTTRTHSEGAHGALPSQLVAVDLTRRVSSAGPNSTRRRLFGSLPKAEVESDRLTSKFIFGPAPSSNLESAAAYSEFARREWVSESFQHYSPETWYVPGIAQVLAGLPKLPTRETGQATTSDLKINTQSDGSLDYLRAVDHGMKLASESPPSLRWPNSPIEYDRGMIYSRSETEIFGPLRLQHQGSELLADEFTQNLDHVPYKKLNRTIEQQQSAALNIEEMRQGSMKVSVPRSDELPKKSFEYLYNEGSMAKAPQTLQSEFTEAPSLNLISAGTTIQELEKSHSIAKRLDKARQKYLSIKGGKSMTELEEAHSVAERLDKARRRYLSILLRKAKGELPGVSNQNESKETTSSQDCADPQLERLSQKSSPSAVEEDVSSKATTSAELKENTLKTQGGFAAETTQQIIKNDTSTNPPSVELSNQIPLGAIEKDVLSEANNSTEAENNLQSESLHTRQDEFTQVPKLHDEIHIDASTQQAEAHVAQDLGEIRPEDRDVKKPRKVNRGNTAHELSALSKEPEKTGQDEHATDSVTSSMGDDAIKLNHACETNDLKTLVELLTSSERTKPPDKPMHVWAKNPETVGALAGTQLAIRAAREDDSGRKWKDDIRNAGAIPSLCEFLESDQQDRVETAVLALSVLTAESPENVVAVCEAGAMPLLKKHLSVDSAGLQSTAATTLRNIVVEDLRYRKEFANLGGLKSFVDILLLSAKPYPNMNHSEIQLEYVLNLQDVIEDDDSNPIEEYAKLAIKAGAVEKLKKLHNYDDAEVQESAEELLFMLHKFKR